MSVNLANIYAELLRKYGENYTITYGAPPTYLTTILGPCEIDSKIVLFFKENRSGATEKTPIKLTLKSECPISGPDLDLTGSPLKDDCLADAIADISLDLGLVNRNPWKPEEEYQRGVPVDKARAILCTEEFQSSDGVGSVWFLCDASDHSRTQLLQFEFNVTHFSRGILSYTGVLPAYMVTSQALVRQHVQAMAGSFETHIENLYQVNPNMSLRCSWSTHAQLPLLTDLTACEVSLKQTFRVGDCGPLTQDLMNQLRILLYIREDIIAYHNDDEAGNRRDPVYRCGRGIDMDELRDSINKTLTEVSGYADTYSSGDIECDIEEALHRAKVRRLTDLTDKLWELLKCCSSYKDLKMAFNMLFNCAARCNIVNTPTNKNRLAEIITELANRRLAIPCLSGSEPMELLLEIGLEKMYKDYEFIYTESKVCSANLLRNGGDSLYSTNSGASEANDADLVGQSKLRKSLHNAARGEPTSGSNVGSIRKTLLYHTNNPKSAGGKQQNVEIAGFRNSYFDESETAVKIGKLFQIHCTLEHLLMIHLTLNLSNVFNDVCAQLLKKPAPLIESIDDKLCDEMEIHLSSHYVRERLDGKDPHSRRITMKSSNKFRQLQSTFYFNLENICPPDLADWFQGDDKELVKERTYHSWLYRKIASLK
ncbi:protein zwilch [Scaptodrosophila lebanonensis]|uniref:Protein zwilch n=1 Tax=Drosophila lebanonensis TaxID=7225 RepID=A0A6J2T267_DROLE|nr:protein zwilch [Scaptodrosophila lebanonensis]